MTFRSRLRHAFAVDPPGEATPTPPQQEPVDRFCREVARRHLTTPAVIALEMSRPLNYLASQAMHFFSPGVWALARHQTYDQYRHFAAFLERRGSIDYLVRRVEHFERLFEQEEGDARGSSPHAPPAGTASGEPPHSPPPDT
jgi:hypothetical protein